MPSNAQIGELIVGAYYKLITDAEVVSYNSRSKEQGDQLEIDVVAIVSNGGTQTIYACEVITHLNGAVYSGKPDTDKWADFGNDSYQRSLEKLETKFESDYSYVTDVFDNADRSVFQPWAPYIPDGFLTEGSKYSPPSSRLNTESLSNP